MYIVHTPHSKGCGMGRGYMCVHTLGQGYTSPLSFFVSLLQVNETLLTSMVSPCVGLFLIIYVYLKILVLKNGAILLQIWLFKILAEF